MAVVDMTHRRLGRSGLLVSTIGLGCNNFGARIDAGATTRVVHAALDHGITLFDTADIYGDGRSEEMLGAALRGRRDDAIIATKFAIPTGPGPNDRGGSRSHVLRAAENSLRRLGVDHIDLYQMHRPDPGTPIEETLAALDTLVHDGKVRYLGSSNFAGWQIAEAAAVADRRNLTPFVAAQNHYSLVERGVEAEVMPACARFGVGMLPFFPLAGGLLTGRYRRGVPAPPNSRLAEWDTERFLSDANFDLVDGLEKFAAERGVGLLDVAIGGLAAQEGVASVIAGATTPEQVAANACAGRFQPSAEDLAVLDRLAPTRRPAGA
jgi:aryl-alcohol dehydrogenase-like predicted oxidoreductase